VGLFAIVALALGYQLVVGGIRIELIDGRLSFDPSGLVYWWHTVAGQAK
jgi:hypothetical protein